MADDHKEIDRATGVETTGHEWDGIKELNNPLPKWWLYTFYATILWTIGITIAYPAWPFVEGATKGVLGYTTRGAHAETMQAARAEKQVFVDKIAASNLASVAEDGDLLPYALSSGESTFKAFCSQCHGSGAAGGIGYPNLNDDEWIHGGTRDAILHTIRHGVRQTDAEGYATADTRGQAEMPAFDWMAKEEIAALVEHVRQISNQEHDATLAGQGAPLFVDNCAACHGDAGEGIRELGAPSLADAIWLFGGDRDALTTTLLKGRAGMMPAWDDRLDEAQLKSVTLYVHSLGGGE